ncbi:MAG: ParB/RepB/Spo0J family partition protein [Pseudomonadota bacterium]
MTARRAKPSFASLLRRAPPQVDDDAPDADPVERTPALPTPPQRDEWVYEAMQFLVDPARVRIWPGNSRDYAELTPDNCRDLIDSIMREGMQKVAVIVRPVFDDATIEYEVISGTRRHFAVSHLRRTSMPDLRLLVQVEILDDEGAFRLADLENRARRDVSDIERARSYVAALESHYDGNARAMAERLAVPLASLGRMIRVAHLPDSVIAAFGSPGDLSLDTAAMLAERLEGPMAPVILATAAQIARAQAGRRDDKLPPYTAAEVLKLIDDVSKGEEPAPPVSGKVALSVVAATADTLTVRLNAESAIGPETLAEIVKAMIDGAAARGVEIRWAEPD